VVEYVGPDPNGEVFEATVIGTSLDIADAQKEPAHLDIDIARTHTDELMRLNAKMFESTIRMLGQQNANLSEQIKALTTENAQLRETLKTRDA
jgi:hypothetical protein